MTADGKRSAQFEHTVGVALRLAAIFYLFTNGLSLVMMQLTPRCKLAIVATADGRHRDWRGDSHLSVHCRGLVVAE